ncbi:unnamed protein product [Ixodes hexagonus]
MWMVSRRWLFPHTRQINNLMTEGNKSRTVAATNMNSESSRSHAVFNITLTCSITDKQSGVTGEKVSKMSLVDLAGSERAIKTGAIGERLKEGSNINKSLTTLGLVISKLADQSSGKAKDAFVPYRDSVLTWLLRDNLGGNSRTVMVAAISPAADNYEETLSTLRYADRAKRIINHAVVNEDPNARIIRELREEVEMLRGQLKYATTPEGLSERLRESETLMVEISQTWEEKLRKTEKIHQERQQALEKMGISVQASGIKVENDKYYMVNLNADPSLNELLVYYMKERTLVGRPDAPYEQDVQLSGLGIMPEHCIITIEDSELYITPLEGARTCVNGTPIVEKTQLHHGDRLLWGNNHFFRISCPRTLTAGAAQETPTLDRPIDYEFAREEIMMKELVNDPIQNAVHSLEKQHEEDKHNALEKQRQMYERQLQLLRNQMSPSTPYAPYSPFDPLGAKASSGLPSPSVASRMERWAKERDELFRKSLAKLREDIVRANALVRGANLLSDEMGKQTEFKVTLQIPAANLSPNRKRSAFVSEPAILVRRKGRGSQVWSMEKLENKVIDMREMYEDCKDRMLPLKANGVALSASDPFYESQENHNLIGVANVFLEALFHNVRLSYHVPIISQQGEIAGRLHMEISKTEGVLPDRGADPDGSFRGSLLDISDDGSGRQVTVRVAVQRPRNLASNNACTRECLAHSIASVDGSGCSGEPLCSLCYGSQNSFLVCYVIVQVAIKSAVGLPPSLSHFVFCQYTFWGHAESVVVAPVEEPVAKLEASALSSGSTSTSFKFNHVRDFVVPVTEEFVEHCTEGALSVEVWGHRCSGFTSSSTGWDLSAGTLSSRRPLRASHAHGLWRHTGHHVELARIEASSRAVALRLLAVAQLVAIPALRLLQQLVALCVWPLRPDTCSPTVAAGFDVERQAIRRRSGLTVSHFLGRGQDFPGAQPGLLGALRWWPLALQLELRMSWRASFFSSFSASCYVFLLLHENWATSQGMRHVKTWSKIATHLFLSGTFRWRRTAHNPAEVPAGLCTALLQWAELKRKLELWLEIHELTEQGEYAPVEVVPRGDVGTGGVFQLRQGQQRRLVVRVGPVASSGTLPLICQQIGSVAVGAVCVRSRLQKPLDSYQASGPFCSFWSPGTDDDLGVLRERWCDALGRRREYLDEHLQKIIHKPVKTDEDIEREQSLISQWVCLTEEKNAVLAPAPGSDIPGAPANWQPQIGMEQHVPVIFLDLSDDMSVPNSGENGLQVAGSNSILPKEHHSQLFNLPIVKHCDKDVCATAAWDSSIHNSMHLNALTSPNERVYLILKVSVRLSHPAVMDLILRKRFAINVYKKQSFTDKIRKRITRQDVYFASGVTYEIVASIPKASEDPEGRESLALMAASGGDAGSSDGESYIEKYTRGVSAVESILTLDRLRQEVAVKELLAAEGRLLRKTASVPNIAQGMRGDASSTLRPDEPHRCDSVTNLSMTSSLSEGLDRFLSEGKNAAISSLARPTFLNLNFNLNLSLRQAAGAKTSSLAGLSPQPTKFVKPMRTVIEEQSQQRDVQPLLIEDEDEQSGDEENPGVSARLPVPLEPSKGPSEHTTTDAGKGAGEVREKEEEYTEFKSFWVPGKEGEVKSEGGEERHSKVAPAAMTHSATSDGIADFVGKVVTTPSMVSSGYGSQALSSTPLSSEDSGSLRSVGGADEPGSPEVPDAKPIPAAESRAAPVSKNVCNEHHAERVMADEEKQASTDNPPNMGETLVEDLSAVPNTCTTEPSPELLPTKEEVVKQEETATLWTFPRPRKTPLLLF